MNEGMDLPGVQSIIERVELLLAGEVLSDRVEEAVRQLLNVVEALRRTLIICLKYCGNMSEPKIGEFLANFDLALCWIHEGRHYEKLTPVVPQHQAALAAFQDRFWKYYAALRDYRAAPTEVWAAKLRAEFDELFATRTGYEALDDRIAKTQAKRNELLTVLTEPSVPLHNNDSELGARVSARRRDVSLHSRSSRGVRAMDIFTTIVQTTKKLAWSAYAYIRGRLTGAIPHPILGQTILQAAASG